MWEFKRFGNLRAQGSEASGRFGGGGHRRFGMSELRSLRAPGPRSFGASELRGFRLIVKLSLFAIL